MQRPNFANVLMAAFAVLIMLLLTALAAGWSGVAYLSANERDLLQRNLPVVEQARRLASAAEMITKSVIEVERAETPEKLQAAVGGLSAQVTDTLSGRDGLAATAPAPAAMANVSAALDRIMANKAKFRTLAARTSANGEGLRKERVRAQTALAALDALAGTLIANTQAQISAALSGLYEPLERNARDDILDQIAEGDLFKLQSFLEMREVSQRVGATLDRVATSNDAAALAGLAATLAADLNILARRSRAIEDPSRRAQVAAQLAILSDVAGARGLGAIRQTLLDDRAALSALSSATVDQANAMAQAARDVIRDSEAGMVAFQRDSLATVRRAFTAFALLGLATAAFLVWAGYYLRRHIMNRLRSLLARLVALGRGEMDWVLPVGAGDDIGQMEAAVNHLREEVKRKNLLERQLQAEVAEQTALYRNETLAHDAARAEAERANRAKSEFLAIMSHEIRTPLNGLTGMLRLLASPRADAEKAKLDMARRSAADLRLLLDDILEHAKVELGPADVRLQDFEVRGLVRRVAELMTPQARAKGLVFLADISATVPPALRGDESKIQQILVNFCSNAIKFTSAGEVAVLIDAAASARPGVQRVTFRVNDTGMGMSRDVLDRVFEAFAQGHAPLDPRAAGGTGLGLAICRRLTLLLGGDLTVESEPGVGSSFALTLDLAEGDIAQALAGHGADEVESADFPGFRVLLVEDHEVSRLVARGYLERMGIAVSEADSGVAALQQAAAGSFDCILMDLDLPDLTGAEVARQVRQLPRHGTTPIVAVSAHLAATATREAEGFAFAAMLAKPVSPRLLAETLRGLTGDQTDLIGGEEEKTVTAAPRSALAALQRDRDALGPEAACAILRTYLAQLPADLAALDESLAAGDVAAIRKRAHRLRGGAGNFDLTGLCALTRRIEAEAGRNGAALREALKQAGAAAVQELTAAANSLGLAL